jgi:hypothetical protein
MTKEEALIYLPVEDEDDLQDLYDEQLFELKQFFLNRFPMSKLINSRLKKFEKVELAFVTLGGTIPGILESSKVSFPEFESLKGAYLWYNREKNAIRLRLSSAQSGKEVQAVLEEYISLTKHYAEQWKLPVDAENTAGLKIAVEPNPMDIQEALDALSDEEIINSVFILTLPDENLLKSEAKRLSLWLNFESNEQSIR